MTNELRGKIEKDLYEGMSLAESVYWNNVYNVVKKYIDETDDGDNFMNEITAMTASVYWNAVYNVVKKYIDETDDYFDTFMNKIKAIVEVEFAKAMNEGYDKMIKTKEES